MRPEPYREFETVAHTKIQQKIFRILRGNISFGDGIHKDNIDGAWARAVTPVAINTDFPVVHNLNRIPVAWDIKGKTGACDVYIGTTPWTKTTIYLRADVANITLLLFVH